MATDLTPFLPISSEVPDAPSFQGMFGRTLTGQELALGRLLVQKAAQWIRDAIADAGLPELDLADPSAQLVTFMVVRDALAVPQDLVGHTSYQRASDDRSEGGTLGVVGDLLDFNESHRKMLGLSAAAEPVYGGFDDGFGEIGRIDATRYANSPSGPVVIGEVVMGGLP